MACQYNFRGVVLSEQQFNGIISTAIDNVMNQDNSKEHINGENIREILSRLGVTEINDQTLERMQLLNDLLSEQYNVEEEFVTIDQEGDLVINQDLIEEISDTIDENDQMSPEVIQQEMMEMMFDSPNQMTGFSNDPPQASRFQNMITYKKSLISTLEKQLRQIEAKKSTVDHKSALYDELLDREKQVKSRLDGVGFGGDPNYVPGLKREIKALMSEDDIDGLNDYLYSDAKRLEQLTKSDDIDDINEAKKILNFFNSLTTTMPQKLANRAFNQIFGVDELSNPALQASIQRMAKVGYAVIQKYEEKVNALEISRIEKLLKADPYIQQIIEPMRKDLVDKRLAQGESGIVSDYEVFFGDQMKDISIWDKYMSDGIVGTFSTFGEITQAANEIFHDQLRKFEGRNEVFNERMKNLVPKVNAKLNALGYGIKLFGKFGIVGTTYKLYKQITTDGKYTGHLIGRRSAEFVDLWSEIADSFSSTFDKGNTGVEGSVSMNLINTAYRKRAAELRKISLMVDPRKIESIKTNPEFAEFSGYFVDDSGQHEAELNRNLKSDKGFNEEVATATENIRKYKADYKRKLQDTLDGEGVISYNALSDEGKREMTKYFNENNPFIAAEYFYTGNLRNLSHNPNITKYGNFIPKRFKNDEIQNSVRNIGEEIRFNNSTEETGFYDKNWNKIESDDDLHSFWKLANEIHDQKKYLPLQQQRDLAYNMIPSKKASFHDILLDPDTLAATKISKAFANINATFKGSLAVQKSSINTRQEITDSITKTEENEVALGLVKTNGSEIKQNFRRSYIAFIQTLRPTHDEIFKVEKDYLMSKHSKLQYLAMTKHSKEILSDMLGVQPTDKALMKALNITDESQEFPIGKILYKEVVHHVVENETFNLPQTLKLYSAAVALYAARNAAMPIIDVIRQHFKRISNPNINNVGDIKATNTEDGRRRANELFDRWFSKNVLGNLHGEVAGVASKKIYGKLKDLNAKKGYWKADLYLSSLSHDEKAIVDELDKLIDHEKLKPESEWNTELIESLELSKQSIGKYFAVSAFHDRFMDMVRIMGMGINAVGSWFNYTQGKTSNMYNGASGLWMKEESMIRGEHITLGSHVKLVTDAVGAKKAAPKGASLLALMTQRFKVFQDSSNEIYKSTIDTAVVDPSIFNIYIFQQRTEYVNQVPILAGLLVDTEITGKNGEKSNVWDALMASKKLGQLTDNFRTPENIATWELAESHEANLFETKVSDTIADFQGDYRRIGGSVYSNDMTYKTLMMFKRWIPRYVHTRFAKEYRSRGLNRMTKGRYRALSAASGTVMFGLTAITIFGFGPTAAVLAAIGGLGSHLIGVKKSNYEGGFLTRYFKELTVNIAQIATRSLLLAPQALTTAVSGKKLTNYAVLGGSNSKLNQFLDNSHRDNELDTGLMKSNMAEMSIIVMAVMIKLIIRGMTKDDDKDEDKTLVNLALNMCGRTLNDLTAFLDPATAVNTLTGVSVLRTTQNFIKLGDALTDLDAVVTSGDHVGENKAFEIFRKTFAPGLLRKGFGLDSYMNREMFKTQIDKTGFVVSEEDKMKDIITQSKADYKSKLLKKYKDEITEDKIQAKAKALIESNKKAMIKHPELEELNEKKAIRRAKRLLEEGAVKRANARSTAVIPGITKRSKTITKEELKANIDKSLEKASAKDSIK